jgi:hypothetical protein
VKFLMPTSLVVLTADPATGAAGDRYFNSTDGVQRIYNGTAWTYANEIIIPYTFQGTLAVTTGVLRIYNNSSSAWVVYRSDVYIATAPVGASAVFGIRKNGAAASITLTAATTVNAANSTTKLTVAVGDYLTVDISSVGSTTAGANAQLVLCAAT